MSVRPSTPLRFRESFRVRSYEIGPRGRATPGTLCNYLGEAASRHAAELGVSIARLLRQGRTWFLSRLHLRVERYPEEGEALTVETWPADLVRAFAVRDFRVTGAGGEVLALATTAWLLVDTATVRPLHRLPDEIVALHPGEPVRAIDDPFQRLPRRVPGLDEAEENPVEVPVRPADLDRNRHVNFAVYPALLATPAPAGETSELRQLEMEFLADAVEGDVLRVASTPDPASPGTANHRFRRASDRTVLARARSSTSRGG